MAPRSWRPDTSHGADVDVIRIQQEAHTLYRQYIVITPDDVGNYGAYTKSDR